MGLCPIYSSITSHPPNFCNCHPSLTSSYQYIPLTRSFSAPMAPYTPSQRYSSTRGGSPGVNSVPSACHAIFTYGLQVSFEEAVFKGLAPDNGLFVPETIPSLPSNWKKDWVNLPFQFLAFEILSLFISPAEIPHDSLRAIMSIVLIISGTKHNTHDNIGQWEEDTFTRTISWPNLCV